MKKRDITWCALSGAMPAASGPPRTCTCASARRSRPVILCRKPGSLVVARSGDRATTRVTGAVGKRVPGPDGGASGRLLGESLPNRLTPLVQLPVDPRDADVQLGGDLGSVPTFEVKTPEHSLHLGPQAVQHPTDFFLLAQRFGRGRL